MTDVSNGLIHHENLSFSTPCSRPGGGGGGVSHLDRSRIHERTISLRFMGILLRVLRLEVSVYNVYITNKFQTILLLKSVSRGDCEYQGR
jgi:hypothetical protein